MPNEVHCAHILVKTEKEANFVLERLKKGERFANIAKEASLCPSKKRGGDLGTFGRGKMVKEFENTAFLLKKRPEVKLVGIVFYEEVRDFILNELRKFRTPYSTGTEVTPPVEEPAPRREGLDDEILLTLHEIRDILKAAS
jgi:peptidyl-prolyl cis-trans isomerase C